MKPTLNEIKLAKEVRDIKIKLKEIVSLKSNPTINIDGAFMDKVLDQVSTQVNKKLSTLKQPENGKDAVITNKFLQSVADNVLSRVVIPEPIKGDKGDSIKGEPGKDAEITQDLIDSIVSEVLLEIEVPTAEEVASALTMDNEAVRDGLELFQDEERLDVSAIKGVEELIEKKVPKQVIHSGGGGGARTADALSVNTSNFETNLSATDNTVQKALETLDDLVISSDGVQTVVAGTNVTVDNTDPKNPIVNAIGDGTGDVTGPSAALDNSIPRFDGTSGKNLQASLINIDDNGNTDIDAVSDSSVRFSVKNTSSGTSASAGLFMQSNHPSRAAFMQVYSSTFNFSDYASSLVVGVTSLLTGGIKYITGSSGFDIRSNHTPGSSMFYLNGTDRNVGIGTRSPQSKLDVVGAITQRELSADPADPAEGSSVTWQSNGTGSGDDGDIMMKITAGGVTKITTLIDFSNLT